MHLNGNAHCILIYYFISYKHYSLSVIVSSTDNHVGSKIPSITATGSKMSKLSSNQYEYYQNNKRQIGNETV